MKIKLMTVIAFVGVFTTANAQLGKKLEAKLNAAMTESQGPSKKELQEAAQDSMSTVLDSKPIPKDPFDINGIYYAKTPLAGGTEGDNEMTNQPYMKILKKFLVIYEPDKYSLNIYNQYSYETTNDKKFVKPAYWISGSVPKKDAIENSQMAGGLHITDADYDNRKYMYTAGNYIKKDLQGNYIKGEPSVGTWESGDILQIEPGIILIGYFLIQKDGEEFSLENRKKYTDVTILYKAEKAELAAKYTREYAWEQVAKYWIKWNEAELKRQAKNTELPVPFTKNIVDAPTNEQLKKEIEYRMNQFKWDEKLEYFYITSDWINVYEPKGALSQNTLVGRRILVQVITTKDGRCRTTEFSFAMDNLYTTGSLEPNFKGQPIQRSGNGPTQDIDCKKAYQYKK